MARLAPLKGGSGIGMKNKKKERKIYKPPIKISKKRTDRLLKYSEKQMFEKISIVRPQVSELSGEPIEYIASYCFAHLLPKGQYPEYRMKENNIAYVSSIEEHHEIDRLAAGNKYDIQIMLDSNVPANTIVKYLQSIDKKCS